MGNFMVSHMKLPIFLLFAVTEKFAICFFLSKYHFPFTGGSLSHKAPSSTFVWV